jgi:hypothetical protein
VTDAEFWELIRSARRRDPDAHAERLTARLVKRPADDILAFGRCWDTLSRRAYTWRMWGAAYLINGGCSDDGFEYFRDWLILQGRGVYEAAVADPDTLAAVRVEPDEAEYECYIAQGAYQLAVGGEDHGAYYDAYRAKYGPPVPPPDLGERWDFGSDAEMRRRYPRLFAKFCGG